MEETILHSLKKYYKVKKAKIYRHEQQVFIEMNGKTHCGFSSGALALCSSGLSNVDKISIIHHWLSFCSSELFHCSSIQELERCYNYINQQLLNRPYLCGYNDTVADIAVYFALRHFVKDWSYHKKEQNINISRWFKSIQENIDAKELKQPIIFSKTMLYENFDQLSVS